nr:MAG TPA: protein of unknown function (DUF4809) [Caudoviricetes sp.]
MLWNGMAGQRLATQGLGKASERDAMTGSGMAKRRWAMVWQIIEGYAQLRHSNECKAREERSKAPPRSGNESRSNEQKSKKEWTEGGCNMAEVKTYTLTLNAQELHDLIEAALVCECQTAQIINGLKRKGLDMDAQKLVTQNARLARLIRRMQETKEAKKPCAD